jgi:hypothetical protein
VRARPRRAAWQILSIVSLLSIDSVFFTPPSKRQLVEQVKQRFASLEGTLVPPGPAWRPAPVRPPGPSGIVSSLRVVLGVALLLAPALGPRASGSFGIALVNLYSVRAPHLADGIRRAAGT